MNSRLVCAATFCLVATGLHAQGQGAGSPRPSPQPMQSQSTQHDTPALQTQQQAQEANALRYQLMRKRIEGNANLRWDANVGKKRPKGVWSISEARANLAREWQRLGIPADQATVIASAYRARASGHLSLDGVSDQDFATILQEALKSKDYARANQLLIDYERHNSQLASN